MNKAIASLAMLTAVAGCSTEQPATTATEQSEVVQPAYVAQVNTLSAGTVAARVDHVAYKQVILDGIQPQWVAVQDVRRSKTNDGYERVQVLVKNMTASPIRTRYRFDWQDAKGVVIQDPDHDGWEKLTLVPGDDGVFTSIAPKKDCADFRLRMKNVQ